MGGQVIAYFTKTNNNDEDKDDFQTLLFLYVSPPLLSLKLLIANTNIGNCKKEIELKRNIFVNIQSTTKRHYNFQSIELSFVFLLFYYITTTNTVSNMQI